MRGGGGENVAFIFPTKEWAKGVQISCRTADGDIKTHQD